MKHLKKSLLTIALSSLVSMPAISATDEGLATAYVIASLQLTEIQPLAFGTFASSATANIVSVDANNCGVTNNLPHFGGHSCGKFNVAGYGDAAYVVSWDQNISLTGQDSSNRLDSMPATITLSGQPVKSLAAGAGTVQFGGALSVGANQKKGNYQGNYTVTINYQ